MMLVKGFTGFRGLDTFCGTKEVENSHDGSNKNSLIDKMLNFLKASIES